MTPEERRDSAERMAREPFFKAFLKEERERVWSALKTATSHDTLLEAQGRARALDNLERDVRAALKRPKAE